MQCTDYSTTNLFSICISSLETRSSPNSSSLFVKTSTVKYKQYNPQRVQVVSLYRMVGKQKQKRFAKLFVTVISKTRQYKELPFFLSIPCSGSAFTAYVIVEYYYHV